MHDETTIEAIRWRGVTELGKARDAAEAAYSRTREIHERAEEAIREENREEVAEWAGEVLKDPSTVVLSLATTGLHDPVDVVEVVALSTDGETVISERVRPARYEADTIVGRDELRNAEIEKREAGPVEVEEGAAGIHGHTSESLADAPTLAEIYPRLREALVEKRIIVYNEEYVSRVLEQTIARYGLESFPTKVECAMTAYARLEGQWSVDRESYYSVKLLGGDGTPLGNARATLELMRSLAGSSSGASSSRDDDIEEEDFEDILFRARFPYRVRYPLI